MRPKQAGHAVPTASSFTVLSLHAAQQATASVIVIVRLHDKGYLGLAESMLTRRPSSWKLPGGRPRKLRGRRCSWQMTSTKRCGAIHLDLHRLA